MRGFCKVLKYESMFFLLFIIVIIIASVLYNFYQYYVSYIEYIGILWYLIKNEIDLLPKKNQKETDVCG